VFRALEQSRTVHLCVQHGVLAVLLVQHCLQLLDLARQLAFLAVGPLAARARHLPLHRLRAKKRAVLLAELGKISKGNTSSKGHVLPFADHEQAETTSKNGRNAHVE
jgi:hypothetical protein